MYIFSLLRANKDFAEYPNHSITPYIIERPSTELTSENYIS